MSRPSIPDSIYNTRCRYCIHFTGLPNTVGELSTGQLYSNRIETPCNIISIADYCEQKILSYKPFSCTYEVNSDECFSFTPNYGYPGICQSCRYFNIWNEKESYCALPKKENADRHQMFNGYSSKNKKPNYFDYAYHTCSKWQLSYLWYDTAIKLTAEGKLPKTWDPNTRKLIDERERVQDQISEKENIKQISCLKKEKKEQLLPFLFLFFW